MPFNKDALNTAIEEQKKNDDKPYRPSSLVERERLPISTISTIPGKNIIEYKGLVYSSISEVAGLQKQQTRLQRSIEVAFQEIDEQAFKIGANAIVGLFVAINNSTGAAINVMGSSDAVTVLGTAVVID